MTSFAPLKDGYDRAYIKSLARALKGGFKSFDSKKFTTQVFANNWDELELKARMRRISESMDSCLSKNFKSALKVVDQAVHQFDGYLALFFPDFVELRAERDILGLWQPTISALARYTEFSSSEFAVRPMIIADQERMLAQMLTWTKNSNEHVRRLASEGSRPRLPWAMALPALKKDPTPLLPILDALRSDKSEYVRRSVANNLNDISKDHPELVLGIANRWLSESSCDANRRRLVKHACRSMLKAGNPKVLRLFGFRDPKHIAVNTLKLHRKKIVVGDVLEFDFVVTANDSLGLLRVEYIIYYRKKNGDLKPKIFKISEFDSGESIKTMTRRHSFKDLSTRRHYPGRHEVAILINGVEKSRVAFRLLP